MNVYRFTVTADTKDAIRDAANAEIVRFFVGDVYTDYEITARETMSIRSGKGEVEHRQIEADIEVHW